MAAVPRFRRGGPALGLAMLLMMVAPAVSAADAPEPTVERKAEASAHLKRGAELIDADNLEGALAEFEAAYRLVPSPSIMHNFGVVYQGLGRKAEALQAFERFLAEAPTAPPETRAHALQAVQELRAELARAAAPPAPAPAADEAVRSTTPPGPMRGWQRPAAWATAAAAAVAAGAFGTAMVVRYRRLTDFNDMGCGTRELEKYPPGCRPLLDEGRSAERWVTATGAAAGVLAVGSALLFLTLPDSAVEVSLGASPSRLGLGLQGRF